MKRIALVEDNTDNRLVVQAILEDHYTVVAYESGGEALQGFLERKPDLILLDISLPGMDGTDVLKQIRADVSLRYLPVIALTAHAMTGDREEFLAVGFNDYVMKPITDEKTLLGAIERLLPDEENA